VPVKYGIGDRVVKPTPVKARSPYIMKNPVYVSPVLMPSFDWSAIRKFTKQYYGRDAIRAADKVNLDLDEMAVFIATLANMQDKDANIIQMLRESNGLLYHLFAGFMYHVTDIKIIYYIIKNSNLRVMGDQTGFISGTLFDWHKAIIKLCVFGKSFGVRLFLNMCFLHFEKGGMRQFFELYGRDGLPDGTFELRLK